MRAGLIAVIALLALVALAAERQFASYTSVHPILEAYRDQLPAALQNPNAAKWTAWSRQQDRTIRARLDQGDLDSMVNLLLFGTSFTTRPRIRIEDLAQASKSGLLRGRVDDLVQGLRTPGNNDRLSFLRSLLVRKNVDPDKTGAFILQNLERVLKENVTFAQQIQGGNRAQVFRDRGVSLDTTILPNFGIEETLRDMKEHGTLHENSVRRVAVIGPGLDFTDWDSGYDYYPQQTIQPFALYDSLLRLTLAKRGSLDVTVFDISPRVIDHLQRARDRASKGDAYVLQLPRGAGRSWTPGAVGYWSGFGDRAGESAAPIPVPAVLNGTETRAVRIRPEVLLACQPVDLNIVLQRLELAAADRFDIVIATNMFVYYDALEQDLALGNVAAMLKPGGFLLSNDKLSERAGSVMRSAGSTMVWYTDQPRAGDSVNWYRKQ